MSSPETSGAGVRAILAWFVVFVQLRVVATTRPQTMPGSLGGASAVRVERAARSSEMRRAGRVRDELTALVV